MNLEARARQVERWMRCAARRERAIIVDHVVTILGHMVVIDGCTGQVGIRGRDDGFNPRYRGMYGVARYVRRWLRRNPHMRQPKPPRANNKPTPTRTHEQR